MKPNLSVVETKIKLPNVLFYKRPQKNKIASHQTEFIAFSTTGDKNWGELVTDKTSFKFRDDYSGDILAINFIKSDKKRRGLGSAMIDFAKNYSKQCGCNGYLILRADSGVDKDEIPHLFYRKKGFSTLDKKTDKKLDYYIRHNKSATSKDFSTKIMHYPPIKEKNSFKQLIHDITDKLFF